MAPEYAMRGYLNDKADVYSFGIVALEIVSWKSNTNYRPKQEGVHLLDWVNNVFFLIFSALSFLDHVCFITKNMFRVLHWTAGLCPARAGKPHGAGRSKSRFKLL